MIFKKSKVKNKVIVTMLICLIGICLVSCGKNNHYEASMQKTKEAIIEKKFEQAEGFVEMALENNPKEEEAKNYQKQIKAYLEALNFKEKKDNKNAIHKFDEVINVSNGSKKMIEYAKQEKETLNSSETDSKADETKTSDTNETEKKEAIWDTSKEDSLRNFMTQFSQTMNQDYKEYNQTTNVDLYGVKLPKDVLDGQWTMAIDEQPVQVQWSETGEGKSAYQLVAVYSDADTQPYLQKHVYFFIIENGSPKVFVTQQNQGNDKNYLYFSQSKNEELNNGFEQIVLGKSVSNSSSNQAKTDVDWQKIARDKVEEQFPEWEVDRFEQQSEGIMNVFIKEKTSGSVASHAVGAIDINTGKTSGF